MCKDCLSLGHLCIRCANQLNETPEYTLTECMRELILFHLGQKSVTDYSLYRAIYGLTQETLRSMETKKEIESYENQAGDKVFRSLIHRYLNEKRVR